MFILNEGPLPIASVLWQPRPGAFCSTVVCKATFTLEPGEAALRPMQEPLWEADVNDAGAGLRCPSDLAWAKPWADVVLVGHAYAPRGEPARRFTTRLVVGALDKHVEIFADRRMSRDGAVYEGKPVDRMPLVYERAAGGPRTWNHVGLREDAWDAEGWLELPNLVPRGADALAPGQRFEPIGFGPIPATWPLRQERLTSHTPLSGSVTRGGASLPPDAEHWFHNVAPVDQQLAGIEDGARIVLEHLNPMIGRLETRLPGLRPSARIERPGQKLEPLDLRADLLWIDTDRGICTVTYRGRVPLKHAEEPGQIIVTLSRGAPSLRPAMSTSPSAQAEAEETQAPVVRYDGLPFRPQSAPAAPNTTPRLDAQPPPKGLSLGFLSAAPAPVSVPVPAPVKPVPPPAPPRVEARPLPALGDDEAFELLWFAVEMMPRIRRRKAWKEILDALEDEPIDPELDDAELSATPATVENRRDISAILSCGEALGPERLGEVLKEGISAGAFTAKIALCAGELSFKFDEAKLLEALCAAVTPLAVDDDRLRAALATADAFLGARGSASLPAVAEGLFAQIREVLRQGRRATPLEGILAQVERAALEQRAYQRRMVFGGPHLRGSIAVSAGPAAQAVPVYFPEDIVMTLPMMASFPARILCEVRPRVDRAEASSLSLRGVAIGRAVSLGAAGKSP
ncbi:DUF2169 family type VI secretion system accessory protein [Polyangium spumosum]|nr:DUF2169 domain-containing protein [Polyangium spumosum]